MGRPVCEDDKVTLPAVTLVELLSAISEARVRMNKVAINIYAFTPHAPILSTIEEADRYLRLHAEFISETTGLNEEGWTECPSSDSQTNSKKKQPKGTRSRKRTTSKRA